MEKKRLKPHHWRRTKVYELLDDCLKWGKTSQYQMQKYVHYKTGSKPSPKLIVKWKKNRGIPLARKVS